MVTELDFGDWLLQQLNSRKWEQKYLAKLSGVTAAQISRIISGTRQPGPDALLGIARAFNLTPEDVFRRAGLLPMPANATVDDRRSLAELVRKLERLGPEDRRYAAELLDRVFPNAQG